jgi:MoaA/NifB/PqqE/SkfB family radical SAM enzyme
MPIALFEKIIKEQEDLGIFTVFITGGEPLLYEGFWDITKKYRRTIFWTATNGTLITEKEVELMAETGNVVLNFNLDGFKKETDFMKGEGAFEKIREGIRKCQNAKLIYLATVTVSKHNFQTVASDKFIRMLVEYGFIGVNFSHYVPVGDDARPEWQISFEQSKRLDEWGKGIIKRFPIFVTIGRNGTDRVDGCFAANQYIHILPDGRIEPCPFAHWATGQNIKDSTILEIMDSAFIKTIREINKAGIPGLTPCRAQHIKSLQEGFEKLGAKSTIIKQEKEEEIYGERKRINAL